MIKLAQVNNYHYICRVKIKNMHTRKSWEDYKKQLEESDYTEEQISAVKEIRETADLCEFEMFQELITQGVVKRVAKLKKARHIYVTEDGSFVYLNHYKKAFEICGVFKQEEE